MNTLERQFKTQTTFQDLSDCLVLEYYGIFLWPIILIYNFIEQLMKIKQMSRPPKSHLYKHFTPHHPSRNHCPSKDGNSKEIKRRFKLLANQGFVPAQRDLALFYLKEGNSEEAKRLYKLAAEQGDVRSLKALSD